MHDATEAAGFAIVAVAVVLVVILFVFLAITFGPYLEPVVAV